MSNEKESGFVHVDVGFNPLREDIKPPEYKTEGAVGFDFEASERVEIQPREVKLIPTGIVFEIPEGYFLAIVPRSSTPKKFGVDMPHSIGVIDVDYSGPEDQVYVQVRNFTDEVVVINVGDRVAQGLIIPVAKANFVKRDLSGNQTRGGFGTTGKGNSS